MRQLRHQPRFGEELLRLSAPITHAIERDLAIEAGVEGEIDDAHAACSERLLELEVADPGAAREDFGVRLRRLETITDGREGCTSEGREKLAEGSAPVDVRVNLGSFGRLEKIGGVGSRRFWFQMLGGHVRQNS